MSNRSGFEEPIAGTTTVGSFNLHAGVDGWGRRFDVVEACRRIGTDILVLQECFAPDGDRSQAEQIATTLGYRFIEIPLNSGRVLDAFAASAGARRWGPLPGSNAPRALRVGGPPARPRSRVRPTELAAPSRHGSWNLAVLSRVAVGHSEVLHLPPLHRDSARRVAMLVDLENGLRIAGTHLGHLSQGSPAQIRTIGRRLALADTPTALLGDMNCWGPLLLLGLPGFRRAVVGRTWPAWRPHSQIDHIAVNRDVDVLDAEVLGPFGSDHLAVRARLRLAD